MPKKTKLAPARGHNKPKPRAAEYRLWIDAYTPETIPMARLSEYMRELAGVLGEPAAVHFVKLEGGSTCIVHRVDREAVPKVRGRASSVQRMEGPQEAMRAYKSLNRLLREDNAVGALQENHKRTAIILRFPGVEEAEEKFASIRQYGAIDGVIVRIGGSDETIHVTLKVEDKEISGCYTTRAIAKELRHKLFDPVRLVGRGKWSRDSEGQWELEKFKIESFEALEDERLSDALTKLRAIPAEWGDETYGELGMIRHGPGGKKNGGH